MNRNRDRKDASPPAGEASGNVRLPLIIVSCALIFLLVALIALRPDQTIDAITAVKSEILSVFGPFMEFFMLVLVAVTLYFAFGRYRNVKFGEGKPAYSTFSYIAMMFMASMASAAVYWAFTEWAAYYTEPGLGIEAESTEALEIAIGYQFFHWGIPNCLYFITALGIAYAYYIRKVDILQPGAACGAMLGNFRYKGPLCKVIDFIIVFATVGGLGVTLGAAIPLTAGALTQLFGVEETFPVQVGVVLGLTAIFTFTSFLGTDKGMKNVSNFSAYICFGMLAYIIIVGPTEFIIKNSANSLGWMLAELPRMSLYTDPVNNGGFAENWTIFFIAFLTSYSGLMGVFIAKISKGRTIGQMAICSVGGLMGGSMLLFGVLGSFSIDAFISGKADVLELISSGKGEAAIYQIVEVLPGGEKIVPFGLLLMIIGFVVSSLDTASLGLAQTTTKTVDEEGNASKWLRVFWCLILALVPLSIMYVDAGFDPIKTIAILVAVPFIIVIGFMMVSTFRWLKEDSENGVLEENRRMREAELAAWREEKLGAKQHKKLEPEAE